MIDQLLQGLASVSPLVYAVIGLTTLLFLKKRYSDGYSNLPPTPAIPWPILGLIPYMTSDFVDILDKWADKTDGIMSVYIGSQLHIVINDVGILKEAFVKKADYFSDRVKDMHSLNETSNADNGIILNSGPAWKEQRTIAMSILRELGMGKQFLAEKIGEEVQEYLKALSDLNSEATDVHSLTNASISNVICAILIGQRFEYDDPYFTRMLYLNNKQLSLTNSFNPVLVFPSLRYLPGDLFNFNQVIEIGGEIQDHFSAKFINEKKNNGDIGDRKECFINAYFTEMRRLQRERKDTTIDESSLLNTITNLFTAGSDTSSTTLMWALLFAITNPSAQEKVAKEIYDCIGTERAPQNQDRNGMPYTNAFILEVQRMGSIVPLLIPHNCNQTVDLAGYTIPKDTVILGNATRLLQNRKTWGDPFTFRPERFLESVPDEFIPFGIGRRRCLGEALAKMTLFMYISAIFQRFQVQAGDPDNLPSFTDNVRGTINSPKPFKVRFVERSQR